MVRRISFVLAFFCVTASLFGQQVGTATGKGAINHFTPSGDTDLIPFSPRYAYAYVDGSGTKRSTWIVLTEKEPPLKMWAGAKDAMDARRAWCKAEKTPFTALKLDAEYKVDLYFSCAADGGLNTEMLSSANGLDSVVVNFKTRDDRRLTGTLRTGIGSCPGPNDEPLYCTPTGDYTFDASLK